MADKEIGDLTAASALDGTELRHVVQNGNSRKETVLQGLTPALSAANQASVRAAFSSALNGHIEGLTLSNNATDATNDIDIAAGEAASTESNPVLMKLASGITKRLDAAWAVGTGNGGLDTGTIADTTYHLWLIQRSDTGVTDVLFSASPTSPTMPTNYDRKRRIGAIIRSGSAILAFVQNGNEFQLAVPVLDVNASTPGTSAVLRAVTVPTGVSLVAFGNILFAAAGANSGHLLSDPAVTDIASAHTTNGLPTVYTVGGGFAACPWSVRTDTSAQIRSRNITSNADVIRIATRGWIDTRL